ncbi:hypothetical protein FB451DRAFT_1262976 [Mycena latifolia]|nr:hypothetical protein FB451DRAFT_1262976 [Mycena latifolia]
MAGSSGPLNLPLFPQHLLESNDVPSEAEALEIRAALDNACALLADLDVSQAKERKRINDHIHQGRGVLSAVRRLPFDILGELFVRMTTKRWNVWLLGRVCRRWRAATRALPTLWAEIESVFPLPAIVVHLEHSWPCPLNIGLGSEQSAALQLVVPHAERWATVKLDMGPEMGPILAQVHGRLPLLRRMEYRDGNVNPPAEACRAFEVAPSLVEASIRSNAPMLLPWAQLERVFLQVQDVGLNQLTAATSLLELNLMTFLNNSFTRPRHPICLPQLRRLFIHEGEVLSSLSCPVLEELFIAHDESMFALAFIERSRCTLRILSTECQAPFATGIVSLLNATPTLVELRLIGMYAIPEFIPLLAVPQDDEAFRPLGPALRELTLNGISTDIMCAAVVEMMKSRHESALCPPLALCVLNYREHRLSESARRTQSLLRDRGMDVEWLASDAARNKLRLWELGYPW